METRLQSSEVRIPKQVNSPQSPPIIAGCPTFKSSFARSLSFSTNQHKPLDLEISFRIAQALDSTTSATHNHNLSPSATTTTKMVDAIVVDDDFEEFMKHSPLKQQSMQNKLNITSPVTSSNGGSVGNAGTSRTQSMIFCSARQRLQVI